MQILYPRFFDQKIEIEIFLECTQIVNDDSLINKIIQHLKYFNNKVYNNFFIFKIKKIINYNILEIYKNDYKYRVPIHVYCIADILTDIEKHSILMKVDNLCENKQFLKAIIGPIECIVRIQNNEDIQINDMILVVLNKMIFKNKLSKINCVADYIRKMKNDKIEQKLILN